MERMTKQKKLLYEETNKFHKLFDAYLLHEKIIQKDKGIGIATVYRFLNDLEKKGEIHAYICDNKRMYSTDTKSHIHFQCEVCRTFKHIDDANVDFLKKLTREDICHFEINISGVCAKCKEKKE